MRDQRWHQLLRAYALSIAGAALLLVPVALWDLPSRRLHPIDLTRGTFLGDGSLRTSAGVIRAVRIDDGPGLPAGGVVVARSVRTLPAGTSISYQTASGIVQGRVTRVPRDTDDLLGRIVLVLVASAFAVGGLALGVAGAEPSAVTAGAAMAGLAGLLAGPLLEPSMVRIAHTGMRNAAITAFVILPAALAFGVLGRFLTRFPARLQPTRVERLLLAVTLAAGGWWCAFNVVCQVPGLADRLPLRGQLLLIAPFRSSAPQLLTFAAGALLSVLLARRQWRQLRGPDLSRERVRRGRLAGMAILCGLAPGVAVTVVQSVGLLAAHRMLLPRLAVTSSFLPMVLVPGGLAYAILGRRVESFGLLVRRAAVFGIAARTLQVLALVPLAFLVASVVAHRHETIADLFRSQPVTASLAIVITVLGLRYAERAHRALERAFFRDRAGAQGILQSLAEKTRTAADLESLAALVCSEVDRAFHPESVTLLLRDDRSHAFSSRDASIVVQRDAPLALLVNEAEDLVDADVSRIPGDEAAWLAERSVRLLLPLRRTDGSMLGILAVGEKRSELPWDAEDREMLLLVSRAAGLAFEHHILRTSPSFAFPAPDHDEAALARYCPSCRTVFPADAPVCPYDRTTLALADIPVVLNAKYRVEERIGAGSMGVVYRARDLTLGRTVALKTLPGISAHAAARLRREARTLASMDHPNLARIYAAEHWREKPVLVLELLGGGTLERRLRSAPLSVAEVLDLATAIGRALGAAHDAGVLHRDLKPSNIGYDTSGQPKLLDFGLAQFTSEDAALAGTPAYLSPEVITDGAPGAATDLWALSLTLYESLTGTHPFRDVNPTATMNRILDCKLPDPRLLRPDCPAALADLFTRLLARDPAQRPADAATFLDAVARVRSMPTTA